MPRDVDVLTVLGRYRRLTSRQIATLVPFGSKQTAGYRLQRLWQHGYVERDYWHVAVGSPPAVYRLGKQGALALVARLGGDAERLAGASRTRDQFFLDHTLAVNDVLIAFVIAARLAGHQLTWSVPVQALDALPDPLQPATRIPVIPDATLLYEAAGRRMQVFLEVDRGTESTKRFVAKVRGYLAYLASGNYQRQFGLPTFRLLVVAPSSRRCDSLKCAVDGALPAVASRLGLDITGCMGLVWYSLQQYMCPDTVLGTVWLAGDKQESFLPTPGRRTT
jgi:hypothetical protein